MIRNLLFIINHPLGRLDRLGALVRLFRWQIGSRILGQPVVMDWLHSTKLVVETGMTGATGNLYCGLHEFVDMSFLLHFLRSEDGFVDIGANVGSYSILASGVVGAATRAFEPHPETFKKLERNLAANSVGERAKAYRSAVGQKEGTLKFTDDLDTMNQVVHPDYKGSSIDVNVAQLDTLLNGFDSILWKIDVEGFESEVIAGARDQLKRHKPKAILLETVDNNLAQLLHENGFEQVWYDPFGRVFGEKSNGGNNSLWVCDVDFCLKRVSSAPRFEVFGLGC